MLVAPPPYEIIGSDWACSGPSTPKVHAGAARAQLVPEPRAVEGPHASMRMRPEPPALTVVPPWACATVAAVEPTTIDGAPIQMLPPAPEPAEVAFAPLASTIPCVGAPAR